MEPAATGQEASSTGSTTGKHFSFETAGLRSEAGKTTLSVAQIAEQNLPSVVLITSEVQSQSSYYGQGGTFGFGNPFGQGGATVETYAGSGVIISADGYILTNAHVVDGASKITVQLNDGTIYEALLVGSDSETDIAVIKINAAGLPYSVMGDSDDVVVGELCVAIGNPLGDLTGTVTVGFISALERSINVEGTNMVLLQHDAAINSGNSAARCITPLAR